MVAEDLLKKRLSSVCSRSESPFYVVFNVPAVKFSKLFILFNKFAEVHGNRTHPVTIIIT